MTYLISIAIGPVQEFIASARRSRDLWFGSWLLSELSKTAAASLLKLNGERLESLIFPAPGQPQELEKPEFSVANKILGLTFGKPKEAGAAIEEAVRERMRGLAKEAFDHIPKPKRQQEGFERETAQRQIEDLLEFYWAAVPVKQGDAGNIIDYRDKRSQVEALLAARKATRNFDPTPWGAAGHPKSSLDGQRESVLPEAAYKPKERGGWGWSERKLRDAYGVRGGERLCGVGLLKRHGMRGHGMDRFFSTSHVAALPLMDRFNDPAKSQDYTQAFKIYLDELHPLGVGESDFGRVPSSHPIFRNYDGHSLFAERLREFVDEAVLEEAKKALRRFLRETVDVEPLPYYAMLHADGDRMGKVIDQLPDEQLHRRLSRTLADFAAGVKKTVEEDFGGSLVYAGGDDVLAFLPLHRALSCAGQLAQDFEQTLRAETDDAGLPLFRDKEDKTPTLSAGLVVAHHLESLSDALALARQAEKAAKGMEGKNALAVTVSKRGGADRTVKGHWGKLDRRLEMFADWHCAGDVPDGAAYELETLTRQFTIPDEAAPADDERRSVLKAALKPEALRIWGRKRAERGEVKMRPEVLGKLKRLLDEEVTVAELAEELIVARIFADAKKLATPKPQAADEQAGGTQQ